MYTFYLKDLDYYIFFIGENQICIKRFIIFMYLAHPTELNLLDFNYYIIIYFNYFIIFTQIYH